MTNEKLELVDLKNQQFKELLVTQGKAYKKILNSYRAYANDLEKIKRITLNIALIDAAILTELENMNMNKERL